MALQLSVGVRNALLDAIETAAGTAAVMKLRTGAAPSDCAASDTGTVIATLSLPSDWMSAASNGTKVLSGSWSDPSADAAGTVAHFRVYASDGTTCHIQGSVTVNGGGGDLTLDNVAVSLGDLIQITGFTLTAPNA